MDFPEVSGRLLSEALDMLSAAAVEPARLKETSPPGRRQVGAMRVIAQRCFAGGLIELVIACEQVGPLEHKDSRRKNIP